MSLIRYSKRLLRRPVQIMIARSSNYRTAADAIIKTHRATSFQNGELLKRTNNNEQQISEQKKDNKKLEISEKDRRAFLTALKIGYYKEFHKQGILSDEELEYLINLQNKYSA